MMRQDWIECILDDLLVLMTNGSSAKQFEEEIGLPISRIETIWNETIDFERVKYIKESKPEFVEKYQVIKNDILLSHINSDSHLGKTAIYKNEKKVLIHGINLLKLRPQPEIIADFLLHQFRFKKIKGDFIAVAQRAVNQSSINQRKLKVFDFVIAPLPEQRAIVAKIEELFSDLDKGVADLKKAQDQLKVYRQAVLKKAFEGELTKEWREQQTNLPTADELLEQIKEERQKHYEQQLENWKQAVKSWEENGKEGKKPNKPKFLKDPNKIEDGEIESYNNLPNTWLWSRLANTVVDHSSDIVDGPFGSNLKSTEYQDEGKPILRIQNIKSNQFIDKNIKYVSNEKYNFLKRHQFKPNDVIVTKLGDPLGLACRVPLDFKSGVIVADLIRIRPSSSYINYDWLTLLINSIVIQSQFRKITKGTTRPRMNLTIMRNVIIPLPSYEEQHQIVKEIESRLSVCDKVEESITESLEKAKALRQSIFKKAFEGNLLSTQEIEKCKTAPDYEPAAVLLEKIKMKQ